MTIAGAQLDVAYRGITVSSSGVITRIVEYRRHDSQRRGAGVERTVMAQVRVAVVVIPPPHHRRHRYCATRRHAGQRDPASRAAATRQSASGLDTHGVTMTLPALTWQSLTAGITVSSAGRHHGGVDHRDDDF